MTAESDLWLGSVGVGSRNAEPSLLSPATTPELQGPATPCQDVDPAELPSSATFSALGGLGKNEFPDLIANKYIDILDEETQQRRDVTGESDNNDTGNTGPHKQDDAEGRVNAQSDTVNAASDKEEEIVRSIDKDLSPCPS